MTLRGLAVVTVVLSAVGAGTAAAQEGGRVGVVMGYPASVGLLWRPSDGVAIRPEISLSRMSGDSTTSGSAAASTSSSWSVGAGVSALFYLGHGDGLRTYLSPRFSYVRNSATTEASGTFRAENWSNNYSVAGSFGAEYALGKRFCVFGEVGLGYTRQTSGYRSDAANILGSDSTANTVGTRAAVGVIVFF
jgi:hypothetical protein